MREIKFRVWDLKNNMMFQEPFLIERYDSENPFSYRFYETFRDWEDAISRPCIVMQYTGLKDKNGIEIYEGDICQIMMRHKYGHTRDGVAGIVGAVKFGRISVNNDSLHVFNAFHIRGGSIQWLLGHELEIIGNIYQNKEILP